MNNSIINEDIEAIVSSALNWKELEGKTLLVTGASGFLASHLIRTLLFLNDNIYERKATVIGLVRNMDKARQRLAGLLGRSHFRLHLQDMSIPFDHDFDVDYIIHAASPASSMHFSNDPVGTLKANVIGTSNLLDMAKRINPDKLLFFSSGEVYGVLDNIIGGVDETFTGNVDFLDVRSCYAESKRMAENMCICWAHQYGIKINIIRIGYTYGPGLPLSDDRVIADFVHKVITGRDIVLHSDGAACRSFCYYTDMIEAIFRVLLQGEPDEAYNAASSKQTSILELANLLTGLYPEKGIRTLVKEESVKKDYLRSRRLNTLVCTKKIQRLGWKEKVDIKTGLRRMVESYAQATT